jgi:hypothetical protein
MTTDPTPLFEQEMRGQIAAAEASVADAAASGDQVLLDAAQDRLEGLIALARRNGLELEPIDLTGGEQAVVAG